MRDGRVYTPRACGRERNDGTWEGWIEFVSQDGSEIVRSDRETTQPNLPGLEYWATGLTRVYFEGALERALTPTGDVPSPAGERRLNAAVLNPFSVYAKGEGLLRQQLAALSPRHLRAIIGAYELADGSDVDLETMSGPQLIALIVLSVRSRLAA